MEFWGYMLECADGSLYLGHTDDLEKRLSDHSIGRGGRYTAERLPVKRVFTQGFPSREEALARERQRKTWSRAKKLALVRSDWAAVSALARGPDRQGARCTQ